MIYAFSKLFLYACLFPLVNMHKYEPNAELTKRAHISSIEDYKRMYDDSIKNPESFWEGQADRISWSQKWNKVWDWNFDDAHIKWFEGAKLNACYNCIDRHVEDGHGEEIGLIWEGNDPHESKKYTYSELLVQVQLAGNALKELGIEKGDRVCIYMQMVPELAIAVLACARIGAIHSVVFGAFAPDSLEARINDSKCKVLITQDTGVRGEKTDIPMKSNADIALQKTPSIEKTLVVII